MKISKKLYIDEDVPHHKWIIWKLRKNKKTEGIYCIIYKNDSFLEIIKSSRIKDRYNQSVLIGIATTKENAMALLVRIFDEVYVPNPNIQHMKDYFITNNS
ncbi:MAG TPA: hypothetical protein GX707_06070 [Epulopiscium sp.]|nr:hypothetical protein [Candidatus Epulonipiscium sp.]